MFYDGELCQFNEAQCSSKPTWTVLWHCCMPWCC